MDCKKFSYQEERHAEQRGKQQAISIWQLTINFITYMLMKQFEMKTKQADKLLKIDGNFDYPSM